MNSDINFWGGQLIVGVMFGIVVFLFDRLTNMEHTKRKIKINLLYYLENILPNRMEKNLKKQNYEKNEKIKKSQEIKQEKEDARQLKEHWGEIASAKELQLTDEDIQTLKDFMIALMYWKLFHLIVHFSFLPIPDRQSTKPLPKKQLSYIYFSSFTIPFLYMYE